MTDKKKTFKLFALIAILSFPNIVLAVTQKEMEQARTIAAKAYIRYANDGSGYLDALNPTTMAELEASLKPKEQENIKAFKAIPVPSDYKDWDKEKLLEYWAVTAFQDKGLLEKGRGGRLRARNLINKITIAPPQPESPAVAQTPVKTDSMDNQGLQPITPGGQLNELQADEETLDEEEGLNVNKAYNYTWVYIVALAILVAIVVALVVYAAKVMTKPGYNGENSHRNSEEDEEAIEHYESMMNDKDNEISMLKKKLENATKQNVDLKAKIEVLSAELTALKAMTPSRSATYSETSKKENPVETSTTSAMSSGQRSGLRSIFLGRANMRGIFIRADRTLNVGHSVFVLETSDGFSGSFKVADSPAAWSLALSNPKEYLETACTGHNLDNTGSASRIVTESSGTAIFEGGCWKVIRKARIRYE